MSRTPAPRGATVAIILQTIDAHFEHLNTLSDKAIQQHHNTTRSTLTTERESAAVELRATMLQLEGEIVQYREVRQKVDVTDIVEVYMVGGTKRDGALLEATADIEGWERTIRNMEKMIRTFGLGEVE
jgi:hypothetical protein